MLRFEIGLNGAALLFFALLGAWRFAQTVDVVHMLLAIVYGLLIPAGVAWEWQLAKLQRDQGRMLTIVRMSPFVTLALTGLVLMGH